MFNSFRICARVLSVLTYVGVLGERSNGDDKGELTGEYDLLEVLVTSGEPPYWGKELADKFGGDSELQGSL